MTGTPLGLDVAILATDGVQATELLETRTALEDSGCRVRLVSDKAFGIDLFNYYDRIGQFPVDRTLHESSPLDYDAVVIPGGVGSPDTLRWNADAVAFVAHFADAGKPIGALCSAPWLLVEADGVRGRTLTSWLSLRTDLLNAGARWVDREVVVDGNLVTSRRPGDVPAFTELLTAVLSGSVDSVPA